MKTIFTALLLTSSTSGLLASIPTDQNRHRVAFHTASRGQCRRRSSKSLPLHAAAPAIIAGAVSDLQTELNGEDLGLCHGILHASGVRRLNDLGTLTEDQITSMGVDNLDRRNIRRVMDKLQNGSTLPSETRKLSTIVEGAFDRRIPERFEAAEKQDFCLEAISSENDVWKGRLFTEKQCRQINRMAEYHAYRGIGTIGAGWTNLMYTLTAQHMLCKDIPGMVPTTKHVFSQLLQELYSIFPGRLRPGSICFENDGEPHLVKYNGRAKGTEAHTDNSEYVYITVNVALSADDEYTGGGTYITKLDTTVKLKQGEMLIHLGDLEHAGAEITSGVRRILIAFLACEWEEEALNQAKLENARDYVPVVNES